MFGFGRKKKDRKVRTQTTAERKRGGNSPAARRAASKSTVRSRPSASAYASVEKPPATKPKSPTTKAKVKTPTKSETRKAVAAKENIAATASKVTGSRKTKGGEYKTYAKGSTGAQSFRAKYAAAMAENKKLKKAGKPTKKTFTWNGKKYATK